MKTLLALLLLLPTLATAQVNTCVGTITLDYFNPPGRPLIVGDVLHVRGSLGSGAILPPPGVILYDKVQFDLDCPTTLPILPGCTDLGPVIKYAGDASITTNCAGTTWTSNNPAGGFLPNQVEFTANPPVTVPSNVVNPPGFCTLGFDVSVESIPAGLKVAETIGYKVAFCNNGLDSGNFQTAATTFASTQANFDCYQVPRGRFTPQQTVPVTNQFANLSVTVNTLHRLCAPSTVNGEPAGVDFQGVHLAAYDPRSSTGTIQHTAVTLSTPFGTRTGTIGALTAVVVPTAKSFAGLPPQPPLGIVPPYACFRLNSTTGPTPQNLTTVDQFATTPLSVSKRGPFSLCVASTVDGIGPAGMPAALLCNHTIEAVGFGQASPFITNIFESQKVTITQLDELCVGVTIQ